ncbi:MAG: M43 family zinc metalloprotease, partial [Bacteroidota bacterium]
MANLRIPTAMKIHLTILLLLGTCILFGQTGIPCATDILHEKALQNDPAYRAGYASWEQKCLARARVGKTHAKGQPIYTLPVVVHVIHQNGAENISDAQIMTGIQYLNASYANTGYYDDNNGVATPFQFCLAKRKPDGSATNGIDRIVSPLTNMTMETQDLAVKDLSRWKPTDYINIWLVAEITSLSSGPGVAGYAYFPSAHGSNIDGLVFEARWFGSSPSNTCVATHEMGHYLGLYHTFQGGCTNNDCLVDGDRVCDTPPDNSTAAVPCGTSVNTCNTDALSGFASDQPDMIINYMDYGDWNCYNAFTAGQSARMESSLLDMRSSLLESKACVDPCTIAFGVSFDASAHSVTAGTSVHFTNTSLNNTNWEWRVDGVLFSTAEHSDYLFGPLGAHIVTLMGSGADPNCVDVYSDTIEVSCPVKASFNLNPTVPVAGTGFTMTSTATGSTGWEWTVNGMVVGTTSVLNYTAASPGVYNICLTAAGNFCTDQLCTLVEVVTPDPCSHPPCTEDCNNGIDDDNDGLIDCYDTYDCPCNVVPDCSTTEFNDKDFDARLAWRNTEDIVNVLSSPMIANLDPQTDDIPEIVVTKYGGIDDELLIFKGDGSNAAAPDGLFITGGLSSYPAAAPCIADINNDGIPEVMIVCLDKRIRVYTNYTPGVNPPMKLWMISQTSVDYYNSHVYAADFDGDGKTELYAGNDVFSFDFSVPGNPQLKLTAAGPFGPTGRISSFFASDNNSSVAVDLLTPADCGGDPDCDGLEIAAGNAIYSVDLTTADGDPAEIKIQKNLNTLAPGHNFKDGYTVFADIDLNGIPEVIVSGYEGNVRGVYAWNKTGFFTFFPNQNDNQYGTSIVSVANVFDDKTKGYATDFPEIIATNSKQLNCFNLHAAVATPATPYWWTLPTTDYSGYTGVTTFDFNGDKILELVYRDEDNLRIMYGGPAPFPAGVDAKRNWDIFPGYSVTADEYPVVADVDGDGQAEIIYTANPDSGGVGRPNYGRLYVLESNELLHDPWISAREVWNQYNYFVSNINDDLKVPKVQQTSWLEMPTLGSGKRPLNNFLFQIPKYDENFNPYLPLSDATIKVKNAECLGNSFQVQVEICNSGSASLKA